MPKRLIITGRVQGVGYRDAMSRQARRAGVAGWVRNRRDGSVEALLDGPPEAIEALIAWARTGPPSAQVTSVTLSDEEGPAFAVFDMLPTL